MQLIIARQVTAGRALPVVVVVVPAEVGLEPVGAVRKEVVVGLVLGAEGSQG